MKNWHGIRVLMIGGARQGLATGRYLARAGAQVTINDQRPAAQMEAAQESMSGLSIRWILGEHPLRLLDETDLVCVSGGVPLNLPILVEAARRGLPLTNNSQIFMESVPCKVIGITGSAGKTTTTTLVGRMAQAAVKPPARAWIGGNIGLPLIDQLDQIRAADVVVLELSSFQLELMTCSPQVACILNITPNHLDRHSTMEAYTAAKTRILAYQGCEDSAVLGRDDPGAWGLASQVKGELVSFGLSPLPGGQSGTYMQDAVICLQAGSHTQNLLPVNQIRLRGEHNLLNVLAACAIASTAGFDRDAITAGIEGFNGVPHRLEWVRRWHDADWYNNSIATAPERTMAAIRSFDEPLVLLLGGRDKNLPWSELAELIHQRVDHIIVFGEAAPKILQALGPQQSGRRPFSLVQTASLHEAVMAAAQKAGPGMVVLLSPGGTSYDEFIDFEERGERYRQWVKQLM